MLRKARRQADLELVPALPLKYQKGTEESRSATLGQKGSEGADHEVQREHHEMRAADEQVPIFVR